MKIRKLQVCVLVQANNIIVVGILLAKSQTYFFIKEKYYFRKLKYLTKKVVFQKLKKKSPYIKKIIVTTISSYFRLKKF